jgi:non-ribosomal peptide synthetase component F
LGRDEDIYQFGAFKSTTSFLDFHFRNAIQIEHPTNPRFFGGRPPVVQLEKHTVQCLDDLLLRSRSAFPDNIAVIDPGRARLTYRELDDLAKDISESLRRAGVVSGDRVAVIQPAEKMSQATSPVPLTRTTAIDHSPDVLNLRS